MIVYRDMTFCKESTCGEFGDGKCPRSLTEKVKANADKWWGQLEGSAPISIFMETPDCFVEMKPKKEGPQ